MYRAGQEGTSRDSLCISGSSLKVSNDPAVRWRTTRDDQLGQTECHHPTMEPWGADMGNPENRRLSLGSIGWGVSISKGAKKKRPPRQLKPGEWEDRTRGYGEIAGGSAWRDASPDHTKTSPGRLLAKRGSRLPSKA